jgi:hypothetical protein
MGEPPDQGQIGPTVAMPNRAASKINCMSEVILSGWIAGDHVRIHAARGFRAFFAERQKIMNQSRIVFILIVVGKEVDQAEFDGSDIRRTGSSR